MTDADCTPGREPRSVAASFICAFDLYDYIECECVVEVSASLVLVA